MANRTSRKSPEMHRQSSIERRKVSVMHVFREAHDRGDAKVSTTDRSDKATSLSLERRHGIDDATLRKQLSDDLSDLLTTIRLDVCVDLSDAPYVQKSVVNFGFRDLGSISASELNTSRIADSIRNTLIDHEPRLVPETIQVHLEPGDHNQRLSFSIAAEMVSDPVDIPVDFVAEVDIGAGKLNFSKAKS